MLASDSYLRLVDSKEYNDVQEVSGMLRREVIRFGKNLEKISRARLRVDQILGTEGTDNVLTTVQSQHFAKYAVTEFGIPTQINEEIKEEDEDSSEDDQVSHK